jgi:hypothetical protein
MLTPPPPNSGTAASLAVGDLNGDGINEIALAFVPGGSGKNAATGRVFLFKFNGSSSSPGFVNYATIIDPQASSSSNFGEAIAIGDVTGDMTPDLIVGANGSNRVWVYPNSSSGFTTPFYLTETASNGLGWAVAVANMPGSSSGYRSLLSIEAFNISNPSALVYSGPTTSGATPSFVLNPVELNWSQSAIDFADINGDGFDDMIIGAQSTGCSGSAFLYMSGAATPTSYQSFLIPGPNPNSAGFGHAASTVPGTHIVLVGDMSGTSGGQVYVYIVN